MFVMNELFFSPAANYYSNRFLTHNEFEGEAGCGCRIDIESVAKLNLIDFQHHFLLLTNRGE